jgi:predicted dehydrogenase
VTDQGFYRVSASGTAGGDADLWPEINGRIVGDLRDEIAHFVNAVRTAQPLVEVREALAAIPVLDALAESARSGRPGRGQAVIGLLCA